MRRLTLVVALLIVAFASSARAQTVEASFDLNVFGMGALDVPKSIDADGNPATQEWLFVSQTRFTVAVERPDRLCFEESFSVPGMGPFSSAQIATRYGRSKLLVKHASFAKAQPFQVVSLDIVRCR